MPDTTNVPADRRVTRGISGIALRRGTPDDTRACHDLLWATVTDLASRLGAPLAGTADDWWLSGEGVHRYLAEHAAEWWVAEVDAIAEPIGYARSIERGGLVELTEFFVRPGRQGGGVGAALLERALPIGRGEIRSIIATPDPPALARYYRAGVSAAFPFIGLKGTPGTPEPDAGLTAERIDPASDAIAAAAALEGDLLEYGRGVDEMRWIAGQREGYLYRRGDRVVGYAFVGADGAGPVGAVVPEEMGPILVHVEGRSKALGAEMLEFEVPGPNAAAVQHLLARGFRIQPWINHFLVDRPFGQFDRFLPYGPIFL